MMKVFFENIEREISNILDKSTKTLDIAVSWFTNQKLFDTLRQVVERGVRVRMIILNDITNNHSLGLNYQILIEKGVVMYLCTGPNLMHCKYCVVDGNIVITGSCNWTHNIENNDENILIIDDTFIIKSYQENFEKLTEKYVKIRYFSQSDELREIKSQFFEISKASKEENLDDKDLLQIDYKNEEKEFVVLRFISRKVFGGRFRVYDMPFQNERTRFVRMTRSEIQQLEVGDFIIYPKDQKISSAEYFDKNGVKQIANWLIFPILNSGWFFKKECL